MSLNKLAKTFKKYVINVESIDGDLFKEYSDDFEVAGFGKKEWYNGCVTVQVIVYIDDYRFGIRSTFDSNNNNFDSKLNEVIEDILKINK